MGVILECQDLSFIYKNQPLPSLSHIILEIKAGDFILCTGKTGCGKSTLLKTFNGLIPHEIGGTMQGRILVDGIDSRTLPVAELSQTVGLMFQNPDDQIFSTTVADEVGFALENRGMPPDKIAGRVAETLAWVGLGGREQQSVHALSGGERQRLALAAVLSVRPRVLALDEPISQLDPQGAVNLLGVLEKLNREQGITIILVEHRLHEVMPICRQVLVMDEGTVSWYGTREEAFRDPAMFLRLGLRIPQTVEICHLLGIAVPTASIVNAVDRIRQHYPNCAEYKSVEAETEKLVSAESFLDVKNLSFRYERNGRAILDEISLQVFRGQFIVLMGHNGAGKSTLLHHICGLLAARRGEVRIDNQPVRGLSRAVGMVMQNPDLMLFNSTVKAEVTFGLRQAGKDKAMPNWKLLLERVGLSKMEDRFPLALSQGQRVRVAIASLLVCDPALLLLDEPTTGQDLGHIDDIMLLLQEYVADGGSVVLCTHDTETAVRYAERVIIMTEGRIVADGTPRDVLVRDELLRKAGLRVPAAFQVSQALYGGFALSVEEVVRDVQQTSLGS